LEDADVMFDKKDFEVVNVYDQSVTDPMPTVTDTTFIPSQNVGDLRIRGTYIDGNVVNGDILVVGSVNSGVIDGGDTFIVTDKSNDELIASLQKNENTARWVLRGVSWLTLTIGFALMIAPILELIEIIPVFGGMVKVVAILFGAILSAIIVFVGVIMIKFWYLVLVLMLGLFVGGIYLIVKKKKSPQSTK
jgi:hypothetical protein